MCILEPLWSISLLLMSPNYCYNPQTPMGLPIPTVNPHPRPWVWVDRGYGCGYRSRHPWVHPRCSLLLGIHIINIGKTWEKLVFAARIIAAIKNPNDVCVISARPYDHRAVLKFAANTGAQAIAG